MTGFDFWQRWLVGASVLVTLFGLLMVAFSGTEIFAPFNQRIDPVFWSSDLIPASARAFSTWVYAVWGATIAGWGLLIIHVVWFPIQSRERWAWQALTRALIVWYVLDTGLSLNLGVVFNALFNTLVLFLLGVPLLFSRRHFTKVA